MVKNIRNLVKNSSGLLKNGVRRRKNLKIIDYY